MAKILSFFFEAEESFSKDLRSRYPFQSFVVNPTTKGFPLLSGLCGEFHFYKKAQRCEVAEVQRFYLKVATWFVISTKEKSSQVTLQRLEIIKFFLASN